MRGFAFERFLTYQEVLLALHVLPERVLQVRGLVQHGLHEAHEGRLGAVRRLATQQRRRQVVPRPPERRLGHRRRHRPRPLGRRRRRRRGSPPTGRREGVVHAPAPASVLGPPAGLATQGRRGEHQDQQAQPRATPAETFGEISARERGASRAGNRETPPGWNAAECVPGTDLPRATLVQIRAQPRIAARRPVRPGAAANEAPLSHDGPGFKRVCQYKHTARRRARVPGPARHGSAPAFIATVYTAPPRYSGGYPWWIVNCAAASSAASLPPPLFLQLGTPHCLEFIAFRPLPLTTTTTTRLRGPLSAALIPPKWVCECVPLYGGDRIL